mmetsp:Transcript_25729/g.70893  ORF Transcript_25729/g.70893 Transcript_25729/m.70893 type:complete len:486 (-) Transcript_25729:22-1479(-)
MNSPRLSIRSMKKNRSLAETILEDETETAHEHHQDEERPLSKDLSALSSSDDDAKYSDAEIMEACIYFSIVGVGYLFPFSALTQPVDYWELLFPDFNIEFPLTTVYMYTNLVCLSLLVFLGGTPNFTQRIVGGFVGQLLVLLFVPTSYFFGMDEEANYYMVLVATAFAAIVTAFIDSSVISLAASYPLRVQEYFQFGIGLSTLIGSIYRDVTKIIFPPNMIVESSLLYFYSGAATIGLCIASYYRLMQLDMSKKCLARAIEEEEKHHHVHAHAHQDSKAIMANGTHKTIPTEASPLIPATMDSNKKPTTNSTVSSVEPDKWVVLRKVFFNESMVLLLFMSTLALWPPLVTEIESFNFPSLEQSGWWSLILLTVFSASDCTGRLLVRYRMGINKNNVWIPVLARFLLFPLIICSVKGVFFTNDLLSVLFVGLLGLTNGYVGTLSIVLINDACDENEQALAGTFTGFFLNSGLVFGATIGLVSDKLV